MHKIFFQNGIIINYVYKLNLFSYMRDSNRCRILERVTHIENTAHAHSYIHKIWAKLRVVRPSYQFELFCVFFDLFMK